MTVIAAPALSANFSNAQDTVSATPFDAVRERAWIYNCAFYSLVTASGVGQTALDDQKRIQTALFMPAPILDTFEESVTLRLQLRDQPGTFLMLAFYPDHYARLTSETKDSCVTSGIDLRHPDSDAVINDMLGTWLADSLGGTAARALLQQRKTRAPAPVCVP